MIIGVMALLAAGQLDAFDAANLALTQCGYAAFREANSADRPDSEFARSLAKDCADEMAGLHREIVAIERGRGESAGGAAAQADRLIARFRADFARQYAGRKADEARLRALEEALSQEGKQ